MLTVANITNLFKKLIHFKAPNSTRHFVPLPCPIFVIFACFEGGLLTVNISQTYDHCIKRL